MVRTAFLGLGSYLPEKVVTNEDLAKCMDTSDEWIVQRTGIKQRHFVDFENNPMGNSDLATRAARQALDNAGVTPAQIDLIIYATLSPDRFFPGDGVSLQHKLGVPAGTPALDVRNQCSGFLYGLAVADAFIRVGTYKRVLLVGSEVHSTGLDFSTRGRDVAVLFGDGAAACVLGPTHDPERGILSVHLHADGQYVSELGIQAPSSGKMPRISHADLDQGLQYPHMNGRNVFKHASLRMPEVVCEALVQHQLSTEDIDILICHQANLRISEMVQKRLQLPDARVFNNIEKYGNTTAASIPLALHEAFDAKRFGPGNLVCMAAFGAGFTWGAALVRW